MSQTYEKMRDYQRSYYPGARKPEVYVRDQASVLSTGEYPRDAWSSALTYQMIYEQPVAYEMAEISCPTLLFPACPSSNRIRYRSIAYLPLFKGQHLGSARRASRASDLLRPALHRYPCLEGVTRVLGKEDLVAEAVTKHGCQ